MNYAMPKHIGDHNKNQILTILREKRNVSRIDLSRMLGISATAVTRNISKLLEAGIIREGGAEKSTMGRKPVLLELCSDYCYVIAADVVGGTIKVALANLMGEIIHFSEEPVNRDLGADIVFSQMVTAINNMKTSSTVPVEKIMVITIGTPGVFDVETGKSKLTFFLDAWDEINIRQRVFEECGIETIIENDVNLDIIGESWIGSGKNCANILYVKLGQGLAARIVLQEKLLYGENNMAGEIGYMRPDIRTGHRANYENMLCNDAVSAKYKAALGDVSASYTISDLIAMRNNSDSLAKEIIAELLEHFAVVLLNSVTVLDPHIIILGGDASSFGSEDIRLLEHRIEEYLAPGKKITTAKLGKKACIYGAIKVALDYVEEQVISML